ncbi:MAG: MFS transporter [Novosphingobium sp.]|nr:MFS transporter [Novosphingobium sp.]
MTGSDNRVRAWVTTLMLFLLATISILDRNIITLMVDPIKRHFDLNDAQVGLLVGAAFAVPFGAFVIPIGWAVDRFQRRFIIAAGVTTWSIATVATGLAGSFSGLVAARSLIGASDASLGPATASWLGDLFSRDKLALPMAVTNLGYKVGQGAALIVGGALAVHFVPDEAYGFPVLGTLKGWQATFVIVGLPGLLLVPAVLLMREPRREALADEVADSADFRTYFAFVRRYWRFFVLHHIGFFALVAITAVILTWTPAFFVRVHGWSEAMGGGKLGAAILIGPLLGLPIHGALADHLFRRGWSDIHLRYPIVSMSLGMPIAAGIYLTPSPDLAVLLVGLFWFVVSAYTSLPLTALVAVVPGRLRGKAISVVGLVSGTSGLICGPLLVGVLTELAFRDEKSVGLSILASIGILLPIFLSGFIFALRPLRELSAQEQH